MPLLHHLFPTMSMLPEAAWGHFLASHFAAPCAEECLTTQSTPPLPEESTGGVNILKALGMLDTAQTMQ